MDSPSIALIELANQLTRIIVPIIIIIGVISNSLNIIVLTRPTLHKHSCSRYFVAYAINNLFYTTVLLVYRLLADQYQIDPANISVVWCKIIVYANHVGIFLAPNFIILASIDRWCASSTSTYIRKYSNVKTAKRMILFTLLFFALFFINSAVTVDLRDNDPYKCYIRADTIYKQVYVFVQASMVSLIPPCLMTFFGLMTIYNVKRTRVLPVTLTSDRRNGNQLLRMLFFQVGTYIALNVPSSVTYLIFVLPNNLKTTPGFFFASMLSVLPFHVSYVTAFFLYVLSSELYRKEFIQIGKRLFRSNGNNQVHPLNITNNIMPIVDRINR